jgi:large subunit ribosomal protein L7/L12
LIIKACKLSAGIAERYLTMQKLSKIDALKKQREVINARIQLVKNREQNKNKQHTTRRKILLGSYYLEQAEKHNNFDSLKKIMDHYLNKDIDRKLFDLPPNKHKNVEINTQS